MLEYLLLRPGDANIFRQRRLRFVVLDEAHTYTGAQGIDVAFLMRRLRETFSAARLQFILTSATLTAGKDEEAKKKIANFGHQLTGANFGVGDIIFGTTVTGISGGVDVSLNQIQTVVADEAAFNEWMRAIDEDDSRMRRLIERSALPNSGDAIRQSGAAAMLHRLM